MKVVSRVITLEYFSHVAEPFLFSLQEKSEDKRLGLLEKHVRMALTFAGEQVGICGIKPSFQTFAAHCATLPGLGKTSSVRKRMKVKQCVMDANGETDSV